MEKLSERWAEIERMGVDTTQFNLSLTGVVITPVARMVVEDKQVDNKKLFRRWVTAQTFRMIYEPSYNYETHEYETGWDNYLRNCYDYKYQFSMMLEEFRVLNKLAARDKEEFEERCNFFTKDVAVATCKHYIKMFDKYFDAHKKKDKKGNVTIKLAQYGTVSVYEYYDIVNNLKSIIRDIQSCGNYDYAGLYTYLKKFMSKMNKLPSDTPKCSEWKTAFKGNGAYYTLKNLILFHGCTLRYRNKDESLETLESCLEAYRYGYWRFYYMLLDVIEYNNFNLRESINK